MPIFRDLALVFVAALIGGAAAQWTRQPLFVGYVVAGLLVSPFTPGPAVRDVATFEMFAQIGVILLMFSIGIEFSLHEMTRLGPPALLGAPITMLLVILLTTGVAAAFGLGVGEAAALGIAISVSSTMVVAKLLIERGEVNTPHARLTVGTVLAEDLVTVVLIMLLPILAGQDPTRVGSIGVTLLRAAVVLVPLFYLANRVVPRWLERIARRGNAEMFILVAMAIGIGTAALSDSLGLSLALGAFLGGLIISESEFTHEVLARILPIRDLFGALFFVSVGTLIRPQDLLADLPLLLILLALILVGKFGLRTLVLRAFRYPWPMAALVSVHLAQTGEFTFVLAQVARSTGMMSVPVYQATLAASLLSILVTALVSGLGHRWIEEPGVSARGLLAQPEPATGGVLICGFGRVGGTIGEALDAFGISYTVVDLDFTVIEALRLRGIPAVYGDAASEPVLRRAGAQTARLAVAATPDFERTRLAVRRLREINSTAPILARSQHALQRAVLIEAGATEVVQPEFEAALTLLRHGLERLGVPHEHVKAYMEQQKAVQISDRASRTLPPARHLLKTKEVRIGSGVCADVSLRRARIMERTGVWILSVRRRDGGEITSPTGDTILREGDEVTVIGLPDQIALFESLNEQDRDERGAKRPLFPE